VTIKSLLFLLFLYICLVWVGAAYLHPGTEFRDFGLKWTLIGLIAVFAFIVVNHLWNWSRKWRARPRKREQAAPKSAAVIHEDDAALAAAISEASAALAKAGDFRAQRDPIYRLPWRLVIGPEGSGKTSLVLNSGIEPQLLSGHAGEIGTTPGTRLCNIWLAKNTIFLEIGGRLFDGDLSRWTQLLRVVRGTDSVPFWRRLLGRQQHTTTLRGVIGCTDLREFTAASADPQRFERYCRNWNDRLRAISEVFGLKYPVYQVITKCDGIPFFQEYFHQLPESDTKQVLGSTLSNPVLAPGEVFAEVESKRLTKAFRALYQSLAERRMTQLAYEPKPTLRPDIYEFPRELKRIRGPVVQFLIDAFRPDALRPAPFLRGYYFTAVREVEMAAAPVAQTDDWQTIISRGSYSADATQMFKSDVPVPSIAKERSRRVTRRWAFVADLFHRVVLGDVPLQPAAVVDPRFELYRKKVLAGVLGVCGLAFLAFFVSWTGNRTLLGDVENALTVRARGDVTIGELRKLDALRLQVERLRNGANWWMHLGLYSGNRILDVARTAYFRRFRQLLLDDLNREMTDQLKTADGAYDPVYRTLKTHITISSGKCAVEPPLVSEVLKGVRNDIDSQRGAEWQKLSDLQIEFYANELMHGNPAPLPEDAPAVDHGRDYLRKLGGVDRIYNAILSNARKSLAKTKGLAALAPNYSQVLRGPSEPPAAFLIEGWDFIVKESKDQKSALLGDCVLGDAVDAANEAEIDPKKQADLAPEIQRLYIRDYIRNWKEFLNGYSVVPYGSVDDAVKKLETLSSNRSPLLALLALTADQTNFPTDGLQKKVQGLLQKVEKAAGLSTEVKAVASEVSGTPAEITQFFQPVHWVVPPNSELWVTEKSAAYIDALSRLRGALQKIATSTDPAGRAAASQEAEPIKDAAYDAVRQIARGFKPNGLDTVVQRLLREPIDQAGRFIQKDLNLITAGDVNGKLSLICKPYGGTFDKYPFRRGASQDASLEEFSAWFAPETGHIWKFQMATLAELIQKEGSQWKAKTAPGQKLQVTAEMLSFLNRAEAIRSAFYAKGGDKPQITYSLRPKLDPVFSSTSTVEVELDGQIHQFTSVFQKQFNWPAASGARQGAIARIRTRDVASAFLQHSGPWGVFRMMDDAEPRAYESGGIEWKYSTGGAGQRERDPIQPAPVRLEFPEFPAGANVFHSQFFEAIKCPAIAVR
jgi:type VI secretion system protein ImpL